MFLYYDYGNNILSLRKKINTDPLKFHNANANRKRKIRIIHKTTFRQEPQPSINNSKIDPIPLNNQPIIPPPVKTMSNSTRIPIIASISIYTTIAKTTNS